MIGYINKVNLQNNKLILRIKIGILKLLKCWIELIIQAYSKWIKKINSLEPNRVSTICKETKFNTKILQKINNRKNTKIFKIAIKYLKNSKTITF